MMASRTPVTIRQHDFDAMYQFAQTMVDLKGNEAYLERLQSILPETAHIKSPTSSILMGYDFHLTDDGPKLIEINNNAGGLCMEEDQHWLPQVEMAAMPGAIEVRLLSMFAKSWQKIAIMDEAIETQFMRFEMEAYANLLRREGRAVVLVSPEDIEARDEGLFVAGERLDAIYNRHTDFYLDSPEMAHIRHAWLKGTVALNPYPRSYALIGDKARMVDWWRAGLLESCHLDAATIAQIRTIVPETHLLSEMDGDVAWKTRNRWVFKPTAKHGGKGVLMGRSVSRSRFDGFEQETTVAQAFVPASLVEIEGVALKFDVRLYMHGKQLIGMAGRCWQGQVTNFRAAGSGWVSIAVS
ncbi:MAG: hypothetical protein HQM07_09285 [Zetaproteobacteria bacterium]|nr:hypothetical protein [Zetaproteobacteria bacterium]